MNIAQINRLRRAQIPPVGYKYFRLIKLDNIYNPTLNYQGIRDWSLYEGLNQTGTEYPTTALTSYTSESGITISAGTYYDATYLPWKAFDGDSSMWWTLGIGDASLNWLQIAFDTGKTIQSMRFNHSYSQTAGGICVIYGSNTGAFAGEETNLGEFVTTASSPQTITNINV